MLEVIFLSVLALIWLSAATIQDLKKRMVYNWISFSLIVFALGFRFFYSLFNNNFSFFYEGLIGLGIFFILGNLLYYGKMFAGGDAKLMIALGTILPFSTNLLVNVKIFAMFFIIFLFAGGIYGFFWSAFLPFTNIEKFRKEFKEQFNKNRKIILSSISLSIVFLVLGFFENLFFYLGLLTFIFPYLYIHAKTVDEFCLVKDIKTKDLEEGDWIYKDIKIGNSIIKASWHGLNKEEIKTIKGKLNKIKIREGIPFVPAFLISFAVFLVIYFWYFEFFENFLFRGFF